LEDATLFGWLAGSPLARLGWWVTKLDRETIENNIEQNEQHRMSSIDQFCV